MRRLFTIIVLLMIFAMLGTLVWVANHLDSLKPSLRHHKKPTVEAPASGVNSRQSK